MTAGPGSGASAQESSRELSRDEGFARIRLLRSPHVGPVTYRQLLRRFGSAEAAVEALGVVDSGVDSGVGAGGGAGKRGRGGRVAGKAEIEAEIAAVRRAGARYLFHDSADYPPLLRHAEGAPPILIARGRSGIVHRPQVAMVGARNASAGAMKLAREWARELAALGYCVVSGLARGVDGAAHQGALAVDGGATAAVIAGGIDVTYPPQHAALQERIAEEGLLLTEAPPGTEPTHRHFPSRNRIIAGMAAATVVVEAAPASGSLITARLAGEYGREVMAVPGSPLDQRSHGCNELIRGGAVLVQRVEDIIELMTGFDGGVRLPFGEAFEGALGGGEAPFPGGSAGERERASDAPAEGAQEGWQESPRVAAAGDDLAGALLGLLSPVPVAVDELVRQTGAATASVQMALIELELDGRLARHAGGKVSLAG